MRRVRMGRLAWAAAAPLGVLVAVGCSAFAPGPPALGVSNGTTMDLQVVADGRLIADVAAGTTTTFPLQALPTLPWDVVARTSTGRIVASMRMEESAVQVATDANGNEFISGTLVWVDLSCGRLELWFASERPSEPAMNPDAGQPGDCAP